MSYPPPIVYTIAGSDSGGGAGIQADLHAIHAMGCHGCSAITCLTAQNSCGVTAVHTPPPTFLRKQLETLLEDLPPRAIKIGMLGTKEICDTVGDVLDDYSNKKPWIVLDPVMISTSGHKLMDDEAMETMIQRVFPHADILTPNKFEAEALLHRKLETYRDVEEGARELLAMGVKSVLIKGGHSHDDTEYAQDYFLSPSQEEEPRLCDGGVWLRCKRFDSEHTHGTGCTLSSAIASALALGDQRREMTRKDPSLAQGATSAIYPIDACCLGKAYVTAGIALGKGLGKGPGPVVQTGFPSSHEYFPSIVRDPESSVAPFRPMQPYSINNDDGMGRAYPIVDSKEWVERLVRTPGVTDVQLRIKDPLVDVARTMQECQELCREHGVRLWINDDWEHALECEGVFGVHLGQEDLCACGALERLQEAGLALGVSTHSYGELAAALGVQPSCVSLGPVFATSSKKVRFDPQGCDTVTQWRRLIAPHVPLVVIGGIGDAETAKQVRLAGADSAAIIGAITQQQQPLTDTLAQFCKAMS